MPQRILIEPDLTTARIAVARGSALAWSIIDSFTVDLPAGSDPQQAVDAIRSAMQQRSVRGRCDLDVIVHRRDVEVRELLLPLAPDNELPDMVRFSARNEFTHFSDNSLLDFVPLGSDAGSQRKVVAAVLNPPAATLAATLAGGLGLRLRRILVRPWCLAAAAGAKAAGESALVVAHAGDTADLVCVDQGYLLMTRNVRVTSVDPAVLRQELGDELQRTLMLAGRALGGREVDGIVVLGDPREPVLEAREGFPPVRYVNPAQGGGASLAGVRGLEFAAHLGAIQSLRQTMIPQLDFQNPRRPKGRETNWRRVALWSGAAAALLIGLGLIAWQVTASQSRRIADLEKRLAMLTEANQPRGNRPGVDQIIGEVAVVDEWVAANINWLEELSQISARMLTPDDAIVDNWRGSVAKGKTTITMEGHMRDRETGTDIQTGLAARPYQITPGQTRQDGKLEPYLYSFRFDLTRPLDIPATVSRIALRAAGHQARMTAEKSAAPDAAGGPFDQPEHASQPGTAAELGADQ